MSSRKFDEKYATIKQLGKEPICNKNIALLQEALQCKNSLLVRAAAKVAGEKLIKECAAELQDAWRHFRRIPKDDTGCLAKTEIINTLYLLENPCFDIYLEASEYVQKEMVYPQKMEDCADNMRARALQALVLLSYADIFFIIVRLLNDEYAVPRKAAADALGTMPSTESELLLRMKVYGGDSDNEVIGLCFSGLINISQERNTQFVADYLNNNNRDIAFLAALALGESRTQKAFNILTTEFNSAFGIRAKQKLILPISLLRIEDARIFLSEIANSANKELQVEARQALDQYYTN